METYLVTGGAGFIGSNIVYQLLEQGQTVRVIDDFSTGRRQNLAQVKTNINLIEGDLQNPEICRQAVQGVDYILHQAAIPSVQRSIDDPISTHHATATATLNLLVAARDTGVKRLVMASSSSVYGDSPTLPKVETMPPAPKSPYAIAKLAAETYCRVFAQIYGLETISLRYFNVFGPRQNPNSDYAAVIPKFIRAALQNKQPIIYGDGLQSRDFTYVANVVQANLLAAITPGIGGRLYNVACGARYSLLDLVAALDEILETHIEPIFAPARQGDVKHSLADISLAQEEMGYAAQVDFIAGLTKTIAWYQELESIKV